MSNLTELTAQIIAARAAKKDMSTEELQQEMQMVYTFLKGIELGDAPLIPETPIEETKPQLTIKQAFKKDEVICMICNKGFKTLKRHLAMAHSLKPGEYRKQFNIPSTQSLAAKSYSESRRQMALDRGLVEGLVKARAKKAADKSAVPVVKEKAPVPAVKKKAAVPAKVEVVKAPVKSTKKATVPAKLEKKAALAIAALKKMTKEK